MTRGEYGARRERGYGMLCPVMLQSSISETIKMIIKKEER